MQDTTSFGKGKLKTYILGFILSAVLTLIPFILVMTSAMAKPTIVLLIVLFAGLQVLVHLSCFLQMKFSFTQSWDSLALIYTLLLLAILVVGSIWIMYHLRINMMMGMG